jgi:hypothetical protein
MMMVMMVMMVVMMTLISPFDQLGLWAPSSGLLNYMTTADARGSTYLMMAFQPLIFGIFVEEKKYNN